MRALFAFLTALFLPLLALAQEVTDETGYGARGGNWFWFIVLVVALVALALWAFSRARGQTRGRGPPVAR